LGGFLALLILLLSDIGTQFSQIERPETTVLECAGEVAAFGAARNVAWLQSKNADSIGHLAPLFRPQSSALVVMDQRPITF
jgi:hypothetical protein